MTNPDLTESSQVQKSSGNAGDPIECDAQALRELTITVASLQSTIGGLQTTIASLQATVGSQQSTIASLQAVVANQQASSSYLQRAGFFSNAPDDLSGAPLQNKTGNLEKGVTGEHSDEHGMAGESPQIGETPGQKPDAVDKAEGTVKSAKSLGRTEYIGLIFTLFCHRNPGSYDQDFLRVCLGKQFPDLELATVYRERKSVGKKYTDKNFGSPARYWRLSLPDKHFLLPCPSKEEAFYGVEGFNVTPPGVLAGPNNIEYCEPASLKREADYWYLEDQGQLSSECRSGGPNRRDYEYLLEPAGGKTGAQPQNPEGNPPLNSADSSAVGNSEKTVVPPGASAESQANSGAAVLESDVDKIEKVYLEFCKTDDFAGKDLFSVISEKWKEVVRPKEINVHKIYRYPSGFEITQNDMHNEDFWLILLDGLSSQQGFLFPVILVKNTFHSLQADVFEVPQDAFGCSPQRLAHLEPATLIRSEKIWRLKKKGSLKWK